MEMVKVSTFTNPSRPSWKWSKPQSLCTRPGFCGNSSGLDLCASGQISVETVQVLVLMHHTRPPQKRAENTVLLPTKTEEKCKEKAEGKDPTCGKCSNGHLTKTCNAGKIKCTKCMYWRNSSDIEHVIFDWNFPMYNTELGKIINNVNRGF
ncbi:hypothetical protein SK128_004444 [Halocaridina rubra]|uniref:Uncharacterized protein n=1 Tax=Halocaridina rubra TaxID=373956 RepID=A0AAN8ZPQ8_HALRR